MTKKITPNKEAALSGLFHGKNPWLPNLTFVSSALYEMQRGGWGSMIQLYHLTTIGSYATRIIEDRSFSNSVYRSITATALAGRSRGEPLRWISGIAVDVPRQWVSQAS